MDQLKTAADGDPLLSRIKFRKQVGNAMSGKRPAIAKGEIFKMEMALAENLDEASKNPDYGFKCLHYSVSESSERLKIVIIKKQKGPGAVRVRTIDAEAIAGEDYGAVDTVVKFGDAGTDSIDVEIFDDDSWEPDEDFHV